MATIGEQILLLFVYVLFTMIFFIAGWFTRRKFEKIKREKEYWQMLVEETEEE